MVLGSGPTKAKRNYTTTNGHLLNLNTMIDTDADYKWMLVPQNRESLDVAIAAARALANTLLPRFGRQSEQP